MLGIGLIDCTVLGQYPEEIARIVTNVSREEHKWIKERERPSVVYLDKQWRNVVWSWAAYSGVGPEVAQELIKACGSSAALMDALVISPDEVAKIKVGKKAFGKKRTEVLREEVMRHWQST